jgi:hypothetical protein
MKLAWLVWSYEDTPTPDIIFEEPSDYYYYKVVPIVYTEILHE